MGEARRRAQALAQQPSPQLAATVPHPPPQPRPKPRARRARTCLIFRPAFLLTNGRMKASTARRKAATCRRATTACRLSWDAGRTGHGGERCASAGGRHQPDVKPDLSALISRPCPSLHGPAQHSRRHTPPSPEGRTSTMYCTCLRKGRGSERQAPMIHMLGSLAWPREVNTMT